MRSVCVAYMCQQIKTKELGQLSIHMAAIHQCPQVTTIMESGTLNLDGKSLSSGAS